jgi:uncharacterized protein (DUF433 family)
MMHKFCSANQVSKGHPVDLIVEKLACGETISGLLEDYPRLTEAAIYACLHFAAV